MEYEEKIINKARVRVMRFPKYSREEMDKAREELRKLSPYVERVISEVKE
ncbi:hypothetical protein KEJ48_04090 [Candidatus Bathyarchaeota archaeon]|nr:hypothetical protein [Candidatus Bathyarchaeota archaeon]